MSRRRVVRLACRYCAVLSSLPWPARGAVNLQCFSLFVQVVAALVVGMAAATFEILRPRAWSRGRSLHMAQDVLPVIPISSPAGAPGCRVVERRRLFFSARRCYAPRAVVCTRWVKNLRNLSGLRFRIKTAEFSWFLRAGCATQALGNQRKVAGDAGCFAVSANSYVEPARAARPQSQFSRIRDVRGSVIQGTECSRQGSNLQPSAPEARGLLGRRRETVTWKDLENRYLRHTSNAGYSC